MLNCHDVPHISAVWLCADNFRSTPDSVAKLQKWGATNFPQMDLTSHSSTDAFSRPLANSPVSSSQNNVTPQIIIRSSCVRPWKFVLVDAKRVLQHYPPRSGHSQRPSQCFKRAATGPIHCSNGIAIRSPRLRWKAGRMATSDRAIWRFSYWWRIRTWLPAPRVALLVSRPWECVRRRSRPNDSCPKGWSISGEATCFCKVPPLAIDSLFRLASENLHPTSEIPCQGEVLVENDGAFDQDRTLIKLATDVSKRLAWVT